MAALGPASPDQLGHATRRRWSSRCLSRIVDTYARNPSTMPGMAGDPKTSGFAFWCTRLSAILTLLVVGQYVIDWRLLAPTVRNLLTPFLSDSLFYAESISFAGAVVVSYFAVRSTIRRATLAAIAFVALASLFAVLHPVPIGGGLGKHGVGLESMPDEFWTALSERMPGIAKPSQRPAFIYVKYSHSERGFGWPSSWAIRERPNPTEWYFGFEKSDLSSRATPVPKIPVDPHDLPAPLDSFVQRYQAKTSQPQVWKKWQPGSALLNVALVLAMCIHPLVLIPALSRLALRKRLFPLGHCPCGYDLRGLPEPRCPECGRPFEPGEMSVEST